MYGGGNAKLGSIIGKGAKEGKKLREIFLSKYPKLKALIEEIEEQVDKDGFIRGIDGRLVPIKSKHSALNYKLQGTGAIVCKKAAIILYDKLIKAGIKCDTYTEGSDVYFVLNVHDELETESIPTFAEKVALLSEEAFYEAGVYFNFNCPLAGESQIGQTWLDVH